MSQDNGGPDGRPAGGGDDGPVVLGAELARARAAEAAHRGEEGGGRSPLAGVGYDPGRGELSLADFALSPADDILGQFIEQAAGRDAAGLARIRAALTMGDFYTLLTFARRRAVAALREGGAGAARSGLGALTLIDAERIDWRDAVVAAALLSYALGQASADAPAAFRSAAAAAEPQMTQVLTRFADDPVTSLDPWRMRQIATADGAALIEDDGEPYAPTIDLLALSRAIAALISGEVWQVGQVTTGARVAAAWLAAGDPAAAGHALSRARACVSMTGWIASETRATIPSQHLLIYALQAASAADAAVITAAAARDPRSGIATLRVHAGPLAVIMIARSVRHGVPSREDDHTLQRFATGLSAILAGHDPA